MSRSVVKYVMHHSKKGARNEFVSNASIVAMGVAATLATESYEESLATFSKMEQKIIRCHVYKNAHNGKCEGCPNYAEQKEAPTDEQDTSGSTEPSAQ